MKKIFSVHVIFLLWGGHVIYALSPGLITVVRYFFRKTICHPCDAFSFRSPSQHCFLLNVPGNTLRICFTVFYLFCFFLANSLFVYYRLGYINRNTSRTKRTYFRISWRVLPDTDSGKGARYSRSSRFIYAFAYRSDRCERSKCFLCTRNSMIF